MAFPNGCPNKAEERNDQESPALFMAEYVSSVASNTVRFSRSYKANRHSVISSAFFVK